MGVAAVMSDGLYFRGQDGTVYNLNMLVRFKEGKKTVDETPYINAVFVDESQLNLEGPRVADFLVLVGKIH